MENSIFNYIVSGALSLLTSLLLWNWQRSSKAATDIATLKASTAASAELAGISERVANLEKQHVESQISRDRLHEKIEVVRVDAATTKGKIEAMDGKIDTILSAVNRPT